MAYYTHLPDNLLEQIKLNKCILFVGSGISKKCITTGRKSFPNWFEFLDGFIEWSNSKKSFNKKYFTELKKLLKDGKYLIVAESLMEQIEESEFTNYLYEVFNAKNIVPSGVHKLISSLPFRGILTTNYDNLIELSIIDFKREIPNIYLNEDILNGKNIFDDEFFIFKMHGDIKKPKSIVLSYSSYNQIMFNSITYQETLEKIFLEYTVLFIGYGNGDKNIEYLLDRMSAKKQTNIHYILTKENTFTNIEKEHYIKTRQLEIIEYIDYFKLHNHIDTFFEDIAKKLNESKVQNFKLPKSLRAIINVFYDIKDTEDGLFLWNYIFKEGAITLSSLPQLEQHKYFLEKPEEELFHVQFMLLFFGNLDFDQSNQYLKKVDRLLKSKKQHKCEFILVSLEKNKETMDFKYRGKTIFYLKDNFIDSDLENLKSYVLQRI